MFVTSLFLAYKAVSERAELHKEVKEQKSLQNIKSPFDDL